MATAEDGNRTATAGSASGVNLHLQLCLLLDHVFILGLDLLGRVGVVAVHALQRLVLGLQLSQ